MKLKAATLLSVILISVLSLFWPLTGSTATPALERLNAFYSHVNSMSAEFTQSIISESKSSVEKSQGTLDMQRPGKFRWHYTLPYEQEIIADGKKLWIYDVEMEQVIVKPLDLVLGNTPAVLLSGNANIAEKFTIEEITEEGGDKSLYWMQLVPKDKESGFEKLLLAFSGSDIQIMELKDAFGQVTRLTFSNLVRNPKIKASTFKFKAPKGVDVIDETADAN